jgi:hypothetical protein
MKSSVLPHGGSRVMSNSSAWAGVEGLFAELRFSFGFDADGCEAILEAILGELTSLNLPGFLTT